MVWKASEAFSSVEISTTSRQILASGGSGKIQFQHAYASYQVPSSSAKASSSKSPPPPAQAVTIFTPQVTEFIDYIFYWTKATWVPTQVLSLFSADQLKEVVGPSLPSAEFGSDHLPVMAVFSK
jgi:mRNA deadenylase 3'-5' endonuclease subunit Ccr4